MKKKNRRNWLLLSNSRNGRDRREEDQEKDRKKTPMPVNTSFDVKVKR